DLAAERREGRLDRGLRRGERARGGGVRGRRARGPDGRCHQRLLAPGGATDRTGDMARSRKPVEGLGRLEPAFEGVVVAAGERVADHALPRDVPLLCGQKGRGIKRYAPCGAKAARIAPSSGSATFRAAFAGRNQRRRRWHRSGKSPLRRATSTGKTETMQGCVDLSAITLS